MSAISYNRPTVITGASGFGGLLLLLGLLYVLSFVQLEKLPEVKIEPLDIRSVEIPSQEESEDAVAASSTSASTAVSQLPTQPRTIPTRTVEPMPLSLNVDVTKVLEERETLDYIMAQRDLFGAFGSVRLEGTDTIPHSIYIPANFFPQVLKDRGIYSGKALLIIEISEQGIATVRRVVETDYPEIVDPIVASVEQAIYTRPLRRGKPTKTIMKTLVTFRSDPVGDNLKIDMQQPPQGGRP